MKYESCKMVLVFILGLLAAIVIGVIYSTLISVRRPTPIGIVNNRGEISFRVENDGDMIASISPEGCYSTSCKLQTQKVGTATIDSRNFELHFESNFVLAEGSRFLLPCIYNCEGGGTIHFNLGTLVVGDYSVWLGDEHIGKLVVFSGRPTPQQCFQTN